MPLAKPLERQVCRVGKGSVGLGLTTRQSTVSTFHTKKQGKAFAFCLIVSCSLLLSNFAVPSFVSKAKHYAADHIIAVNDTIEIPQNYVLSGVDYVRALWDVKQTNEQLAMENQRLLEWYQTANRLDAENKALKDLLKMQDDKALEFRSAKVISDAATQYSHTILVRMGEADGLTKGQGVLSHEGLIGRVIETGRETSRVLLMSDVNSRIPVTIEGAHDRAILAGTNNGDPILDHLPETHGVKAGQKVITSGHGGIFPYGVPVGETYLDDNNNLAVRPFAVANRANHVQIVDYGVPAGSATRATASNAGILR
jgi:rod shape-determining protein MreC